MYKKKKYLKEVVFLEKKELNLLEDHNFSQKRLEQIKDCFIFSCYIGLAYNEASILTKEHLIEREDGFLWIEMIRQKTTRPLIIPLLPKALEILYKYGFPEKERQSLPLISNQKFNSYLKEIAEIIGLNKHLTHHIARKTFTSTVLMDNDIPIEIASYLLGHSKTSATEIHYGKILRNKVAEHIRNLQSKLGKISSSKGIDEL
ncbi:site-specific integrase [Solitalea canadensis]|uniref:site-specific integrase n=1 Tax=Solitalea canadensis TaxID=995 RepID=UPI0002471E33|nr:site-specific integrase [Solitalea canadensis]